ncbi:DUF6252 family protein [uncultured Psychroserpens sp.]|uniref:DUF6252 family protein n=1 Tax=uncultured Psychroserpens sp. TaxID=255436 RepID=UPI00260DACE0|nr:DUF6252 family protein [uncultured Psychroserpens sp.]
MRKIALILLTVILVSSCGDEVEFNSPAIQGNYNGNSWVASSFAADIDFGGFLLQGSNNIETLQLVTQDDTAGVYNIGSDSPNVAIFKDANGIVYSTANEPDPSLSLYPVEGQIIIENIIDTNPKTITGTFWFYAYSEDGLQTVNFNEGVFHKVPLVGGLVAIDNGSSCLQATQQVNISQAAFNATDTSMPDYTTICNAYKTALIDKIDVCGDPDGSQQLIVDSLGTCIP